MKFYVYDKDGFLTGAEEGFENPKRPGEYLKPAHSTEQAPPENADPSKRPQLVDGVWWLVECPVFAAAQAVAAKQAEAKANADKFAAIKALEAQYDEQKSALLGGSSLEIKNAEMIVAMATVATGDGTAAEIEAAQATVTAYKEMLSALSAADKAKTAAIAALG